MTVVAFVLMLSIPVVMLARKTPVAVFLVGIWGFFLGATPAGPTIAHWLNAAGSGLLGMVS